MTRIASDKIKLFFSLLVVCTVLSVLTSGCNTKKYLKEDDLYLKKNTIFYEEELNKLNASRLDSEIPQLIKIKPNSGFLWIPRHWFHFRYNQVQKDNWYWRFINKNITEEPAFIDRDVLDKTATSIALHLKNNGYYDAYVDYKIDTLTVKHEAVVDWFIHPEELYLFDEFKIVSEDSVVLQIIEDDWRNMVIKKGMAIDINNYNEERKRIVTLLRNKGYANFSQSYIDKFTVDTTGGFNKASLKVLSNPGGGLYPRYRNRNIFIYSEGTNEKDYRDSLVNLKNSPGIHFLGDNYIVRPSAIEQNLRLKPNAYYSRKNHDETLAEIGDFAILKYPTAQISFDTLGGQHYVDYSFFLKNEDKYDWNIDPSLYYSTIANSSQLLGLSMDLSLTDRNIFGGGEAFTTAIEGSTELSLSNLTENSTYNFGFSNSLHLPRMIRYPFVYNWIENSIPETASDNHLIKRYLRQAKTKASLNYLYSYRSNYYRYNSFSASFGYTWRINEFYDFELDHIGFDWWLPTIFDSFHDRIKDNQYFLRAFDKRLLTGVLFKRVRLSYSTPGQNYRGERWGAYVNLETSGLEIMGIDAIRSLAGFKSKIRLGDNQFSKFLRVDLNATYSKRFNNETELAFRISTGAAISLDTLNVPYIRQFYVGGPYSLRAWPVRGIGPGDHFNPVQAASRFPPYFTGNFKFEANAEYRFKLFWHIHGAVFLDVGNVWNILDDNFEENTRLNWNSYEHIAIGSGAGLRLDLSLLVVRLDLGYPIKNPYKIENSYFQTVENFSFRNFQPNIAFGYPF